MDSRPIGPLGFAELLKRPPFGGRSADLLMRSMESTGLAGIKPLKIT